MDQLTRDEAIGAARFLASVVGQAHAKQMDEKSREKWADELSRNRSSKLNAPSWLWTSVVRLVASREPAYLEHCRQVCDEDGVELIYLGLLQASEPP